MPHQSSRTKEGSTKTPQHTSHKRNAKIGKCSRENRRLDIISYTQINDNAVICAINEAYNEYCAVDFISIRLNHPV